VAHDRGLAAQAREGDGVRQRGKLVVFVDGECALCRVTSSLIEATDRAGIAEVVSYRDDASYRAHGVSDADAASELQVIDTTTGQVYAGFDAVRAIAREIPLLLPFRPVLWLLDTLRLGALVYGFVARHRPGRRQATHA
jgi:predicted DCC family thiol-disulfide oxidoreductase YuxK